MATEAEWVEAFRKVGEEYFRVSGRVVRHCRNSYLDKYADKKYRDAIPLMINDAKGKIVEINRTYRAEVVATVHQMTRTPHNLRVSTVIQDKVKNNLQTVFGCVDKLGLYNSVIQFLRHISNEKFGELVTMQILPEKEKPHEDGQS